MFARKRQFGARVTGTVKKTRSLTVCNLRSIHRFPLIPLPPSLLLPLSMLIYLTSRIVSCVAAFLYPGYASFKTLSQRPASEEDLERWLMYWSVLACVIGVEYLAEWLVSWIPLYYLVKMLFLLYIALPQTQGASYLYRTQLAPTLRANEPQIDAALAQLRTRVFAFLQARARMLWEYVVASATGPQAASSAESSASGAGSGQQGPPLSDSVSGPTQMLGTLWRTYGPAIVAGGAVLLQRQGVPPPAAASTSSTSSGGSTSRGYDVDGDGPEPVLMPPAQSRTSSAGSVEVPSDAESERASGAPPTASRGWLGWAIGGGAAPAHDKAD
ncbi:TB2/DP1, HVA22 family-domain-containing protein [Lactarius vividus]|nr:TB2/DP1, HVA22 family-domain-containing protein [Lactarius vividus]